jgi:hypothetical protein
MTSISVISALLISQPSAPAFFRTSAGAEADQRRADCWIAQGGAQCELRQTLAVFGDQSLQLIHRSELKEA